MTDPDLAENLARVRERIARAARMAGRDPGEIALVAVSKGHPPEAIRAAWRLGLRSFGENYLQEAQAKMAALADLPLEWHFLGPVQSNKTREIAARFAWVHSVDRFKVARRLSEQRPPQLPPLQICLQVNLDDEPSKSGVRCAEVADLALAVAELPRLALRGLMAIPRPRSDPAAQREPFFRLRRLLATLRALDPRLARLDTLSMGMSADLEAAVAEGATLVRIGTALFGPRPGAAAPQPLGERP
ncbi:MAG: YggS family pyridoxal phosphate enzyme [Porticoccaceae bacterium]|nr:MAG: YggS family pyridoxal phosphate enzyme [Porticoccaceae bacterium]